MEVCSHNTDDPNTVLLKVVGNSCNLSCEYCSERIKDIKETACRFDLDSIISILDKIPLNTEIILHGGEPTLIGKKNIEKILEYTKAQGFKYPLSIQTNGYLGSDWVEFFAKHKDEIKVGVSMDGNIDCSCYRKKKNGAPVFNKVDKFLMGLDHNGVKFRGIATINASSINYPVELLQYFSKFRNLHHLQLNPCFDVDQHTKKDWAIDPAAFLKFLKTSFYYWINNELYTKFKLGPLYEIICDFSVQASHGEKFEYKCNKYQTIYSDSTITHCDTMHEQGKEIDGNIVLFEASYADDIEYEINACLNCADVEICRGGCPSTKRNLRSSHNDLLDSYCYYRKDLRKMIAEFMKNSTEN